MVENLHAGDLGSISGRTPEGGSGSPLQYSLPCTHGQSCLAGCSPWGCKESDTTESVSTHALPIQHIFKDEDFLEKFQPPITDFIQSKISFNEEIYDLE